MTRRFSALVVAVGAAVVAAPLAARADDSTVRLSSSPYRLDMDPAGVWAPTTGTLNLTVDASMPTTLTVTLSDAVVDDEGRLVTVNPGSTPYSLKDLLGVAPARIITLEPTTEPRQVPIAVTVKPAAGDRPRVGVLTARLSPQAGTGASGGGVNQGVAIATTVLTQPEGDFTADPALQARGLTYQGPDERRRLDSVVPDLPGLVERGPVTASARVVNTGDVVLDTQTVFEFVRVSPLALLGRSETGQVTYRLTANPTVALPEQLVTTEGSSLIEVEGAATKPDALPWLGVVRIDATTSGTVGPLAADDVVQSRVILVAPWKEGLVLLLGLLGWLALRRWRRSAPVEAPADDPTDDLDLVAHVDGAPVEP